MNFLKCKYGTCSGIFNPKLLRLFLSVAVGESDYKFHLYANVLCRLFGKRATDRFCVCSLNLALAPLSPANYQAAYYLPPIRQMLTTETKMARWKFKSETALVSISMYYFNQTESKFNSIIGIIQWERGLFSCHTCRPFYPSTVKTMQVRLDTAVK